MIAVGLPHPIPDPDSGAFYGDRSSLSIAGSVFLGPSLLVRCGTRASFFLASPLTEGDRILRCQAGSI